ncbi:MAG: two-component sensor histidine kinase [Myxococcales bacterium]|nr:two-component sensor histidine kinase [Myxococcales bacterium]
MHFLPRLLLTLGVPLLLMTGAVAVVFAGTAQLTNILTDIRDGELKQLRDEAALHRVGWAVDVAMRRAADACVAVGPDGVLSEPWAQQIAEASAELAASLDEEGGGEHDRRLREVARDYVALASEIDVAHPCRALGRREYERRREVLDEELTNAWVARMSRLHDDVIEREEEARRVGRASLSRGVGLIALGLVLALVVSWQLARTVAASMAALTETARGLGRGNFAAPARPVKGPAELVEFAAELEVMRQRLAELDSLKQGFVASVSHEMRTPLSKMREALALLADGAAGELDARQARIVRIARDACERQIRTVTTLLDLSRLRAGSALQQKKRTALDPIVQMAVDDEGPEATSRGVEIALVLSEGAPLGSFDVPLLATAISNLVRNAVSVSKEGQRVDVTRTIERAGPRGEQGGWATITVRDQGPGVPDELRDTIFRPFVSSPVPKSPKALGIGLGLALAREVAEAHRGHLELLDGTPGAALRLWVPLESTARASGVTS